MKELLKIEVKSFKVELQCEYCPNGRMVASNTSFHELIEHLCDRCGAIAYVDGITYPYIEHREVDTVREEDRYEVFTEARRER